MIIDCHVRLGENFKGEGNKVDSYIEKMIENNIDKAIICPEKPISYKVNDGNENILKIIEEYPDKFYGAIRVNPWEREEAIKELNIRLKNKQFKAIYLHPFEEQFQINDEIVYPIIEVAKENNIPVIIESGFVWYSHITQIADLAKEFPCVKFFMTNAGQIDLSGFTLFSVSYFMNKHKNLYLGTSSAVAVEWLANLIQNTARERVIFESNFPFTDVYMEKYRVEKCYINDSEKKRVLYENGEELFFQK